MSCTGWKAAPDESGWLCFQGVTSTALSFPPRCIAHRLQIEKLGHFVARWPGAGPGAQTQAGREVAHAPVGFGQEGNQDTASQTP
jgi:hypothetical protein